MMISLRCSLSVTVVPSQDCSFGRRRTLRPSGGITAAATPSSARKDSFLDGDDNEDGPGRVIPGCHPSQLGVLCDFQSRHQVVLRRGRSALSSILVMHLISCSWSHLLPVACFLLGRWVMLELKRGVRDGNRLETWDISVWSWASGNLCRSAQLELFRSSFHVVDEIEIDERN